LSPSTTVGRVVYDRPKHGFVERDVVRVFCKYVASSQESFVNILGKLFACSFTPEEMPVILVQLAMAIDEKIGYSEQGGLKAFKERGFSGGSFGGGGASGAF
jgi:uncharacterized membrane protein YgcG